MFAHNRLDPGSDPELAQRSPASADAALWRSALIGSGIALLASIACYMAAGPSLGLYFGGVLFVAILAPPLLMTETDRLRRLLIAAAVTDGIAVVWLWAVIVSPTTLLQGLGCYLVLIAWIAALWGLVAALERLVRSALAAQAIAVAVALAWLTWPVWLSPWLHGTAGGGVAGWLIPAHPLMTINSLLIHLGIWGEQTIAYHLTNLGQDVPYTLPQSILPCVLLHALIGIALLNVLRRGGST